MREINGKTYIEKEPHDMQELLEIVEVLRSPDGCSWDREQTHESLKKEAGYAGRESGSLEGSKEERKGNETKAGYRIEIRENGGRTG